MKSLHQLALVVRRWIAPDARGHGWLPLAYLGYLVFLFVPVFMRLLPARMAQPIPFRMDATLASIVLFLPLYAAIWRGGARMQMAAVGGIFLLGLLLFPLNPYSNTYVIYAAALSAVLPLAMRMRVLILVAMLAVFIAGMWLLGVPPTLVIFVAIVTTIIGIAAFSANHFQIDRERKNGELRLSQDEVRRIAAFAERERIGRDLHDLLGHTLSSVAIKAELAGKLMERDPAVARREIDEVAGIARDALAQVRTAVSGMRSAMVAAELASAKVLLEAAGVQLRHDIADVPLTPAQESALALTLREAATNIQRHARASEASVAMQAVAGIVELRIADNGRGGALRPGNGLNGMRERLQAAGGTLEVEGGQGTTVIARLPLGAAA